MAQTRNVYNVLQSTQRSVLSSLKPVVWQSVHTRAKGSASSCVGMPASVSGCI